ncbi:MAG: hypothetical protein B6241_02665 [Spirochaetaceae bacterium 4572_59]|nr:MAG: hypothetical protein B6241_02665 [Spirochaetaceae bacterium 4572_59]
MKIQSKITLTSFLLIFGLLLSSVLFYNRFYTVYQLKEYSEKTIDLKMSMHHFIDVNLSLFTDKKPALELVEIWFEDLIVFHDNLNTVFESPHITRLSDDYQLLIKTRKSSWEEILEEVVDPLQLEMNKFAGSDLGRKAGEEGFYTLLLKKRAAGDQFAVKQLSLIQNQQDQLHIYLTTFSFKIQTIIEKSDQEIADYIRSSIIITALLVGIIILTVLLIGLRITGSLVQRIVETNDHVQNIAQGRLKFEEIDQTKGKDEFDDLLHHYNIFSNVLSDRLDSLRYLLQDIGNTLGNETNIDQLQETIVELGMDSIGAESGMLFLADAELESLKMVKRTGFCPPPFNMDRNITMNRSNVENYYETHPIETDSPVFGNLMVSGDGLFIKNNELEKVFPWNSDPYEWLFISSMIALPMVVSNRILGMLVFYKISPGETFSDIDFTFFQSYIDYTAQSIDNVYKYRTLLENREIQREIDVAAGIQKRLLPARLPRFESGSAAVYSLPARGISGDYFDAIRLDDQRILYTVCDVAGKGVPASMLMIMIRTILHTISFKHKSAHTLLGELNYHIAGRIGVDQYATMAVFILDIEKKELSYSNAAHHPLYLYRNKEKQFRSFDTDGLPIGIDKQSKFGHKRIKLNKGDYIFLFTDGLPEARNEKGKELSTDQLLLFLGNNVLEEPEELTRMVTLYMKRYSVNTKQHDDQTFLALKIS